MGRKTGENTELQGVWLVPAALVHVPTSEQEKGHEPLTSAQAVNYAKALGAWQMQNSSTGGIELRLRKDPDRGESLLPSANDAKKSLNRYSLLLAPGILGGLLACVVYPPLDLGPLVAFGLGVLFLPVALQFRSLLRKRLSEDVGWLRRVYVYSSVVLATLALLLLLNGWLDSSPRSVVRATVIQKQVSRGRGGTRYCLTVSSWRPGKSLEDFYVGPHTFNRAVVGKTVRVELHKGYLGLPWSGNISPE
jgi:hypothetical protein